MDASTLKKVLIAIGVDEDGIRPHKNKKNVQSRCPLAGFKKKDGKFYHQDGVDEGPSMTISIDPNGPSLYKCWSSRCRSKGLFKNLVMQVWREKGRPPKLVPLVESVLDTEEQDLTDDIAETIAMYGPPEQEDEDPELEVYDEDELEEFLAEGPPKYFFKRGFGKKDAKEWEVGFDKYAIRMVFPIRRKDGALVGMQGRALLPGDPRRYYNYWSFPKSLYLYGAHLIDKKTLRGLVVVEGATDVWNVRMATRRNKKWKHYRPVGSLGTGVSATQTRALISYGVPIYQFPDNNDEGGSIEAADETAQAIDGRVPVFRMETPKDKDPGACSKEEILTALMGAWAI